MPPVTTKGGFAASVSAQANAAMKQHAADETQFGLIRLPGGINNGVAQLRECGFFQYKPDSKMQDETGKNAHQAGLWYFRAMGVVVAPLSLATPDGVIPVANLQTSIIIPCHGTKNQKGEVTTQAEHLTGYNAAGELSTFTNVMNELKKLGGEFSANVDAAEMDAVAKMLKAAQPYFRFSTTSSTGQGINPVTKKPYEPRVWENWQGNKGLENYTPPSTGQEMKDLSLAQGSSTAPQNGVHLNGPTSPPPEIASGEAAASTDTTPDLDALAAAADAGDENAGVELQTIGEQNGLTPDQMAAAANWSAVVALIRGASSASPEAPVTEETAEWTPQVDETYGYKPMGPGNKAAKKAVSVLVTAVDPAKKTVDLTNTEKKGVKYSKVAWDKLEDAP